MNGVYSWSPDSSEPTSLVTFLIYFCPVNADAFGIIELLRQALDELRYQSIGAEAPPREVSFDDFDKVEKGVPDRWLALNDDRYKPSFDSSVDTSRTWSVTSRW
jgi:hypothetical protein